jgi:predicted TIM-barrel fold metal-dependent hydrolase
VIVDVHTHPPRYRSRSEIDHTPDAPAWRPDKGVQLVQTWDDYANAMQGIDRSIVFKIATWENDPHAMRDDSGIFGSAPQINDDIAEFVRAQGGRTLGFLSVHPYDPNALHEIERATRELGLRGIKLGLNYQRAELLGPAAFAIYERAQALKLPVLFHMGTSPVRFAPLEEAYPLHVDRIAIAFPDLKIIMAHIGHPWQTDTLVVIRKHPNVYADISAQFFRPWSMYNALRLATEWGVLHKLLFGSDYPIASPTETIEGTLRVNDILEGTKLPRVPEEEIHAIIHRDSLALLGLE